ncbi:hypothetical protein KKC13_10755 [bacterium]|nr:hypothetical protein [bacterium]MBU1959177.1 hypothetical protein [bacterium]
MKKNETSTDKVINQKYSFEKDYNNPKVLKVIDNSTRKLVLQLNHQSPIDSITVNRDGKQILSWSYKEIKLWNKKRELLALSHEQHPIKKMKFSYDGDKFISLGSNKIKVWDSKTGNSFFVLEHDDLYRMRDFQYYKNLNEIITWGDSKVRIWNIDNNKQVLVLKHSSEISNIRLSNDKNKILVWGRNNIKMWDKKTGQNLLSLTFNNHVLNAKFNKNETKIFINTGTYKTTDSYEYNLYQKKDLVKGYYPLEAQVETGTYLTPSGEVKALTREEWLQKKKKYEQILKESNP